MVEGGRIVCGCGSVFFNHRGPGQWSCVRCGSSPTPPPVSTDHAPSDSAVELERDADAPTPITPPVGTERDQQVDERDDVPAGYYLREDPEYGEMLARTDELLDLAKSIRAAGFSDVRSVQAGGVTAEVLASNRLAALSSPPAPVPDTVVRERAARWLHEQYGEHTQPGSTRVTSLLAALCPAPAPEVAALVEQLTELETGYRSGELNGSEFAHDVLPLLAALLTVLGGGKDA